MICSRFIASCPGQKELELERTVTKTFRLSTVPLCLISTSQETQVTIWSWEHSTQKYSFSRHLWSFVIAFLYSNSPTSWLRSIIVKPKMVPAGPKLLRIGANVDLTRWKVRLSAIIILYFILDTLKLTTTQARDWLGRAGEIPSHTEDTSHSAGHSQLKLTIWPQKSR